MKLTAKVFIEGTIVTETGLHIGGSKSAMDIGGIDLNVIKTAPHRNQPSIPYIPGSSLKGKLRTMLARETGKLNPEDDEIYVKEIFGIAGDKQPKEEIIVKKVEPITTRLLVRDAFMNVAHFEQTFDTDEIEFRYTEGKWENTIDRKSGTAQHPRQLERVPAGAEFEFEMVFDVYDNKPEEFYIHHIIRALRLLQDDYLGGSGSRGYGKIRFENVEFFRKTIADYEQDNAKVKIEDYKL